MMKGKTDINIEVTMSMGSSKIYNLNHNILHTALCFELRLRICGKFHQKNGRQNANGRLITLSPM